MSGRHASDDPGGAPPRLSLGHRLLLSLPRLGRDPDKAPLGERLRTAIVKPVEPGSAAQAKKADRPMSVEELQDTVKYASDKERLTGLLLAPVAGALGLIIIGTLINNDPSQFLANGTVNPRHVSVSTYHTLTYVLLGLAVVMLISAYFRKRFYLGIAMALYGLSIFNLHYWGFGVPFLLIGAWLLVTSYRLQRDLRAATGDAPGQRRAGPAPRPSRSHANKRYTPPTAPTKRPPRKPENEQKAG
jgi:hypothetical protein